MMTLPNDRNVQTIKAESEDRMLMFSIDPASRFLRVFAETELASFVCK